MTLTHVGRSIYEYYIALIVRSVGRPSIQLIFVPFLDHFVLLIFVFVLKKLCWSCPSSFSIVRQVYYLCSIDFNLLKLTFGIPELQSNFCRHTKIYPKCSLKLVFTLLERFSMEESHGLHLDPAQANFGVLRVLHQHHYLKNHIYLYNIEIFIHV